MAFACGKEDENQNKYFAGGRPSSIIIGEQLTPDVYKRQEAGWNLCRAGEPYGDWRLTALMAEYGLKRWKE